MIHGWSACGGPTMVGTTWDWEAELRGWLEPFLERLGYKARQRMCPLYVAGLIGPEHCTSDPVRLERTGVPIEYRVARTKAEIALAEIDRMISAGVRFGCVLADAGYGMSAPFRQGLTARKLAWAVGIPRHLKVYPVGVQLIWPITKVRGRPRKRRVPDILSIPAGDMLAGAKWRIVSWRSGTQSPLKTPV